MESVFIYLTPIASPFQVEFVEECNRQMAIKCKAIFTVFIRPLTVERKHWGNRYNLPSLTLSGNTFKDIRFFWKCLNDKKPIGCIFGQYNSPITWVGILWCLKNQVPYFIGPSEPMNTYNGNLPKQYLRLKFFGWVSKKAKGVAAMGNHAIHMYSQVYKGPIANVFYSFDYSKLLVNQPDFNQEPFTYLYSGRLSTFRNPLFVIECFAELVRRNPDRSLQLIMSGKGELYKDCLKLIKKEGIQNKVKWINDFKDWYDIHNVYLRAHVLLALQHYSTWGIIIQEAMAAGLGIIATKSIEAAKYLVVDGYNGFLVDLEKENIIKKMEFYFDPSELRTHSFRSKELIQIQNLQIQCERFNSLLQY